MGLVRYPSAIPDRHALAVILYQWLLMGKHPLIGDRICSDDAELDETLSLGSQALYIENPTDPSNYASEQIIKASALGTELERMFHKAFVDGLHDPDNRPLLSQWQNALRYTYDRLFPYASTTHGWLFFVAKPASHLICPACSTRLVYPQQVPFLYLLRHRGSLYTDDYTMDISTTHYVAGWPGRTLQQWNIKSTASPHHSTTEPDMSDFAIFEFDPDRNTWYLKNLALPDRSYRLRGDHAISWQSCPIGLCIPLAHKMLLKFGNTQDHFRGQIHLEESSEGTSGLTRKARALPITQKGEPYLSFHLSRAQRLSISAGNLPEIALETTGKVLSLSSDIGTKRRYRAL
jgi:hypothetical protein